MGKKLAVRKDSFDGRRIAACIEYGVPVNVLEIFGRALEQVHFQSHEEKAGYYIFQVGFLFTTSDREKVAIFERAGQEGDMQRRLTSGRGIFCLMSPDREGGRPFEQQVLAKVAGVEIENLNVLGQAISERSSTTYILAVLEVVIRNDRGIKLKRTRDRFIRFVATKEADALLDEGREADRAVLCFLRGQQWNREMFVPSSIDCSIGRVVIAGLDIYRFSTVPSHEQVLKYVTLQVLVERTLAERHHSAFTLQTGDGCFVVFPAAREDDVLNFCLELNQRILGMTSDARDPGRIRLRYGLHAGPVYRVKDINQQVNFIGDGLNYCARLLGVKESDVVVASEDFYKVVKHSLGREHCFLGRKLTIKHKPDPDSVFWLNLSPVNSQ